MNIIHHALLSLFPLLLQFFDITLILIHYDWFVLRQLYLFPAGQEIGVLIMCLNTTLIIRVS